MKGQTTEGTHRCAAVGLSTVPERATEVASGGAGMPVAFFYRAAPGIPTWTKSFGACPMGPVGFSFRSYGGAPRLQAVHAWQCPDPTHKKRSAWATNEPLCPVGSVQMG